MSKNKTGGLAVLGRQVFPLMPNKFEVPTMSPEQQRKLTQEIVAVLSFFDQLSLWFPQT